MIYRQLPAPGCDMLTDRGVYYGATLTVADQCAGQDVYVVGGANSAGQAAVNLALRGNARSVTMLVRAPDLTASMSHYLIEQIAGIPQITVRPCTEVIQAAGAGHLEQVTLRDLKTGKTRDRGLREPVRLHRRRAAHRLARWRGGPGQARVRAGRAGPDRR